MLGKGHSQQSQCSAEPCSARAFPVKPLPSMARHYSFKPLSRLWERGWGEGSFSLVKPLPSMARHYSFKPLSRLRERGWGEGSFFAGKASAEHGSALQLQAPLPFTGEGLG